VRSTHRETNQLIAFETTGLSAVTILSVQIQALSDQAAEPALDHRSIGFARCIADILLPLDFLTIVVLSYFL